jgi:peptidyl-prolyl cis-trans isomerase SurA
MKRLVFLGFSLFMVISVFAQPKKVIADKIVGQVGDKIILRSDIFNAIADYKRQGQEGALPANPECAFLEGQLIQKALVLQAEKDSLPITEEEIEGQLDNRIRYFIQMYGSKEVLEDIAGKSVFALKEDLRPAIREAYMAEQMRSKVVNSVKITPNEVRAYWNKTPKDSLPFYESELELSQIIVYPKANKDLEDYEASFLVGLKKQLESGRSKFEQLAKLYSHDPGSKDNGGQYAINRTEKSWDPSFVREAFKLKEGQISNPFKSKFGIHIIQLVSRSGDEAVVRHILRIPEVGADEINAGKKKLDSVRSLVIAGKLNFNYAVTKYTEDENSKFSGGAVVGADGSSYVTIDQLDKDVVLAIKDLKPGEISQPLAYKDERGKNAVRIIYYKSKTEPHRENLKDDYNRIAQRALEEKKMEYLKTWFSNRIPGYYVFIDKEFGTCGNIAEWQKVAAASR